jgi:hypothetical protein
MTVCSGWERERLWLKAASNSDALCWRGSAAWNALLCRIRLDHHDSADTGCDRVLGRYGLPVKASLTETLIAQRWPRLYHLTEVDSWPAIERHGLLSTAALLDLYGVSGARRQQLLANRRPEMVKLKRWRIGTAYVRDNKPMNETVLRRTLVDMDVSAYYRTLNERVFFFLEEAAVLKLRAAPPYRGRAHELLVLDTVGLLERYQDAVELSPYNSGAVHAGSTVQRGPRPFLSIAEYPWDERRDKRPPIAELTVLGSVQNVTSLLVERRTL